MKKCFTTVFFIFFVLLQSIYSQEDFQSQFKLLFDKKDFAGEEKLLRNWEKSKSNDPELYVSYFNFYFDLSRNETISLSATPQNKESLQLTKEDDKNVVAYLGSETNFDKKNFDKAIIYLDKGIEKFPNRLDMRFGKVAAFGQLGDYATFTNEIVKAINYSSVNKNQWLWKNDKVIENPKKSFLLYVQDYVLQIFDAGDEHADNIKTIAETVLKYYPDSVENLSNLAVYYILKEDYVNALPPLLKAEKLAPDDYVVLGNIAWSYYRKGDKINSLKYYELLLKYGDEKAKTQAKEKINELKKSK